MYIYSFFYRKRTFAGAMWFYVISFVAFMNFALIAEFEYFDSFYRARLHVQEIVQNMLCEEYGSINNFYRKIGEQGNHTGITFIKKDNVTEVGYISRLIGGYYPLMNVIAQTPSVDYADQRPNDYWNSTIQLNDFAPEKIIKIELLYVCLIVTGFTIAWLFCGLGVVNNLKRRSIIVCVTVFCILSSLPIMAYPLKYFPCNIINLNKQSAVTDILLKDNVLETLKRHLDSTETSSIIQIDNNEIPLSVKEFFIGKDDIFASNYIRIDVDPFNYIYYLPDGNNPQILNARVQWDKLTPEIWAAKYSVKDDIIFTRLYMLIYISINVAIIALFGFFYYKKVVTAKSLR